MPYDRELVIAGRRIGADHPAYFIADIAANHDGDLERAKELIFLAARAGADAAKFQHFKAQSIVSDQGFRSLGGQQSHQSKWDKPVYEVYQQASVSLDWTAQLKDACDQAGITFFTSPYAFDLVDAVDPFVPAYKIGSGDITWTEIIEYIAGKGKPFILASGASTMDEVVAAVEAATAINPQFALLQCNTNYTASLENFRHIQLNVLRSYAGMFPGMVLGLSDHTLGHATVLGAIALGARIIEKHFTDDSTRPGPDHAFSMNPQSWREMMDRSRELENALGTGIKKVEPNERETVVLQRRALHLTADLAAGQVVRREILEPLRPCPPGAISPDFLQAVVGKRVRHALLSGTHLQWTDLE